MERYFVTIDTPGFTVERPAGMFRLVSDPKGLEVEFYNREGQWEQDPSLLGRVFEGDASTVEVTVEQAERVLGRWAEQDAAAAAGKAGAIPFTTVPCWLGLYLPRDVADQLAVPGGEPPERLHMTVAFLGEQPLDMAMDLPFIVAGWAMDSAPLDCIISGVGRFHGADGGADPFYCSVDAPELPAWRESLVQYLARHGYQLPGDHGFTPHVTLAYLAPEAPNPVEQITATEPFTLATLSVCLGDQRHDYRLTGAVEYNSNPATKAVNPRDADESRLRRALAVLFGKLSPQMARRIERGEMPSDKEIADALRRTIEPILIEAAVGEYSRLAAQVGVQFDVAAVQAELAGWARRYSFDLVTGLTETTREVLQQAIAQYAETPGMTMAALEQLIAPAFSQERASLIASTEITRGASEAFNQYQREMSDAGVTMERVWDALNDSLTCPLICAPLDGKPESEWRDRYPDGPPAHPGCRCSLTLRSVAPGSQA